MTEQEKDSSSQENEKSNYPAQILTVEEVKAELITQWNKKVDLLTKNIPFRQIVSLNTELLYLNQVFYKDAPLMSMPPLDRWEYGYKAPTNSRESLLTDLFTQPQDWFTNATLEAR